MLRPMRQPLERGSQGTCVNLLGERECVIAGIDDGDFIELQVMERGVHRTGGLGGFGMFAFEAESAVAANEEQVELGAAVGRPKPGLPSGGFHQDLFNHETFPGRSALGMSTEIVECFEAEQSVEQAAIADVDFGLLHESFAEVFEPWFEATDDERADENIEMPADGGGGFAQGPSELGGIPGGAMVMSDHLPEAAHRFGGSTDAETSQISLEERPNQVVAPDEAVVVTVGEEGERIGAADSKLLLCGESDVVQFQAGDIDEFDTSGERLRDAADQVRARASEQEELGGEGRAVGEYANNGEQIGSPLEFVEHDESSEFFEDLFREAQSSLIGGIFEIEKSSLAMGGDSSSERSFARLSWPQDRDDSAPPQRPFHLPQQSLPVNHP